MPVVADMACDNATMSTTVQYLERYMGEPKSNDAFNLELVELWPKTDGPQIPDHLPAEVQRAFGQAERSFKIVGMEEPSAAMFGRALEVALKLFDPDTKGMLAARIKALVAKEKLAPQLGEWADEIRLLRNEALHDIPQVERKDLVALRDITGMVLRYLFTLPGTVAALRASEKSTK